MSSIIYLVRQVNRSLVVQKKCLDRDERSNGSNGLR